MIQNALHTHAQTLIYLIMPQESNLENNNNNNIQKYPKEEFFQRKKKWKKEKLH